MCGVWSKKAHLVQGEQKRIRVQELGGCVPVVTGLERFKDGFSFQSQTQHLGIVGKRKK